MDLRAVIGVECAETELLEAVRLGLRGAGSGGRYGLPFAGDNNLLFDSVEVVAAPPLAYWYSRLEPGEETRAGSYRMTVGIDREDSSRTRRELMAPLEAPTLEPPESAWNWTPGSPRARVGAVDSVH
ncbi:hypothetical protein [Myxococcus landrumensis]|uniref:Uncharacterized protein n=1 Tax=Myxococcus landrumensis TaxID=2813577 RepID=A0ABX7N420_9BACT|nr:hypothetical protein [Myxococcus landrumus]QSQ12151.1 hypothetical protein JY572_27775 [Myxococcus landrumus]